MTNTAPEDLCILIAISLFGAVLIITALAALFERKQLAFAQMKSDEPEFFYADLIKSKKFTKTKLALLEEYGFCRIELKNIDGAERKTVIFTELFTDCNSLQEMEEKLEAVRRSKAPRVVR